MLAAANVLADLGGETPVRSGVVMRDALAATHPSVRKACQNGIDAVASSIALEQRDGLGAIGACDEPVFAIMQGEAARCHRALLDGDRINAVLRRRLAKGLEIDDATLAHAVAQRPARAAALLARL